jgi:DmsE family decaheme c-type cytochrome
MTFKKEGGMKKFLFLPLFLVAFLILVSGVSFGRDAGGGDGYAGMEACKGCHPDQHESFAKTYHAIKADPRTPAAKEGCESCHGPGQAHVSAGGGKGVGGINPFSKSTPAWQKSTSCIGCHTKGKVALWKGSSHEGRGVSCPDCHTLHGGYGKNLAKYKQSDVCSQCHLVVKAQLLKSSHHPIREGKVLCSNCHNPHGTVTEKLISANSVNEKCYECHTEKRGPFLWEHAPATEDCLSCHMPHGSSHDKLLSAKRPYLCQRCHSNSRHPGTLYGRIVGEEGKSVYQVEGNRLFDSSCQNCHSQMHGSNHPSGKALLR